MATYFKLESNERVHKVSFSQLEERLITFVHLRVQNGDFTERGLARIVGVSQSQIHNLLKGARKLTPEMADRVMARFDISVLDLLKAEELAEQVSIRRPSRPVPVSGVPEAPGSHVPPARLRNFGKKH